MVSTKPNYLDYLHEQYFLKNNRRLIVTKLGDKVVAWKRYRQDPEIIEAQFIRTKQHSAVAKYNNIGLITHCKINTLKNNDNKNLVITTKFLDYIEHKKKILKREFVKNKQGLIINLRKTWASAYFNKGNNREEIKLINQLENGK